MKEEISTRLKIRATSILVRGQVSVDTYIQLCCILHSTHNLLATVLGDTYLLFLPAFPRLVSWWWGFLYYAGEETCFEGSIRTKEKMRIDTGIDIDRIDTSKVRTTLLSFYFLLLHFLPHCTLPSTCCWDTWICFPHNPANLLALQYTSKTPLSNVCKYHVNWLMSKHQASWAPSMQWVFLSTAASNSKRLKRW